MLLSFTIVVILGYITYQDIKEQQVYLLLFPVIGILMGLKHFLNSSLEPFLYAIGINLFVITIMMLSIYLYSKLKLNQKLFKVFGLGDLLLFICLALAFSSLSFIVIFVTSLIFSLVLHLALRSKDKVPLAGYMSLFLSVVYIASELRFIGNLYRY